MLSIYREPRATAWATTTLDVAAWPWLCSPWVLLLGRCYCWPLEATAVEASSHPWRPWRCWPGRAARERHMSLRMARHSQRQGWPPHHAYSIEEERWSPRPIATMCQIQDKRNQIQGQGPQIWCVEPASSHPSSKEKQR